MKYRTSYIETANRPRKRGKSSRFLGIPPIALLSEAHCSSKPCWYDTPKLRLYVMHYGLPFVDDTIALLYSHPQVYVDIAQNDWGFPREHFYSQLKRLIDAGFAKRIMWGSDQMVWPQTIEVAIRTIEAAPFLSPEQKRDIFYGNAVRFLRLDEHERARHRSATE